MARRRQNTEIPFEFRKIKIIKGEKMKLDKIYKDEWDGLVNKAECNLNSDCPLIEDETIIKVDDYMEQLEAQIPQWISVKDRLPDEKDVTVLLSYEGGYYELGARFDYGLDSFDSSAPMSEITHWLQLPEPPVSRKNEDGINILNERIQKLEKELIKFRCIAQDLYLYREGTRHYVKAEQELKEYLEDDTE